MAGMLRVQAPDIAPPAAEFRVYIVLGELNCWGAVTVNATTAAGDKTVASTDLNWDGVADERLVGESLRVGNLLHCHRQQPGIGHLANGQKF